MAFVAGSKYVGEHRLGGMCLKAIYYKGALRRDWSEKDMMEY